MDPLLGWFQPEQEGPAKELWSRIWDAHTDLDNLKIGSVNEVNRGQDIILVDNLGNNDSVVKRAQTNNIINNISVSTNRASTYAMNKNHAALIGIHGGCPWRSPNRVYDSRGIVGNNTGNASVTELVTEKADKPLKRSDLDRQLLASSAPYAAETGTTFRMALVISFALVI
ncbi:Non-canonical poly(A) RNA polymerase papd5 [Homalodisca vitripennis]|nr:Non-canonical poly(A) RNA polymerase papd5 [Homalodisca vitripennis]